MSNGFLFREHSGRGVASTTYPTEVQERAELNLWAFTACSGVNFTFEFYVHPEHVPISKRNLHSCYDRADRPFSHGKNLSSSEKSPKKCKQKSFNSVVA